jgi:hypothetical protein
MHVLDVLRRQYYAHVPAYLLRIPPAEALRSAEGQAALVNLATDESPPLPEAGYRKSFWKRVLPAVEASFENVGEDEDGVGREHWRHGHGHG